MFHTFTFITLLTFLLSYTLSDTYIFQNKGDFYVQGKDCIQQHTKCTWRYRESINPIFYLYFKKGIEEFTFSYEPIYRIQSKSHASTHPLTDSNTGDIDYIEFYKKERGFITILAAIYSKYETNNYTLWLDNTLIHVSYYRNMTYFNRDFIEAGLHRLTLRGHKNFKVSRDDGYINSYQIGVWDDMYTRHSSVSVVVPLLNRSVTSVEYFVYYQDSEQGLYDITYNDLINSQPKSSQTHFHI